MVIDFSLLYLVIAIFVGLDILLLSIMLMSKHHYRRRYTRKASLSRIVNAGILHGTIPEKTMKKLRRNPRLLMELMKELGDSVELPAERKKALLKFFERSNIDEKLIGKLSACNQRTRIRAAMYLSVIGGEKVCRALQQRLLKEPRWYITLSLIHSLARNEFSPAIPDIFLVLKGAPKWVRQKSFAILPSFGEALHTHLVGMLKNPQQRDLELIFELSENYPIRELHDFMLQALHGSHTTLARRAARVLAKIHPQQLIQDEIYTHPDTEVRAAAVASLQYGRGDDTVHLLVDALKDEEKIRNTAVQSLKALVSRQQNALEKVVEAFTQTEQHTLTERNLALVLESRLEYLVHRMSGERYKTVQRIVEVLAEMRQVAVIFGFLERNQDKEITAQLLEILDSVSRRNEEVKTLCRTYLPEDILSQIALEPVPFATGKKHTPLKKKDRIILRAGFVGIILISPLIYVILAWQKFYEFTFLQHLTNFVRNYNYGFAFYSAAINTVYLLLLLFALVHLTHQLRNWATSNHRFLFAKELLPSISVLAPAFNEEKNIVNNVQSLLNLHYPEVEVIVINDGSKDATINRLIDNFALERSEVQAKAQLKTEPVRGIYLSRDFPNLKVIDKVNGGKADSLNAGINLAGNDYICTIDSDSLLEHDALLKIAYQTIMTDREPVALGGNILPANGCSVRNGRLTKINLPHNHLARFQTIEYMRAFLAGRLGWSLLNSMLIISGAFGLFIRKRVIEVGGYLTTHSEKEVTTVGEDMELVVRLHEHLRNKKIPYKVFDAYNANCWTEVPESFQVLTRQRDRWHRGLMESIVLHKKMLLTPRYGPVGLVAFPYFIIFELLGPFLEIYGYINLILGLALGIVNSQIALLLFITVILYGILISIGSLLISENEILYFNNRETFTIILYAIVENFGFRQVLSGIRVTAYISYLFKQKSWGAMERKGFTSTTPQ